MSDLIVSYSAVMRAEITRLNTIAQNVANINTYGYIERNATLDGSEFLSLLQDGNYDAVRFAESSEVSAITSTDNPTDLSLTNDAWFVVEANGNQYVTRDGKFGLTYDGDLVTSAGHAVLGDQGPIVGLKNGFTVLQDGSILSSDNEFSGKLKILKLPTDTKLNAEGNGLYSTSYSLSRLDGLDAEDIGVVQGALNVSNIKVGDQMVRIMEITRHIEGLQRAMSTYDDVLKTGINELGK